MKDRLYVGIDNGKNGAIALIDSKRNILELFKYDISDTTLLYKKLKEFLENYEIFAFLEAPIVVYGLSHQTSPFETIGRHKMTMEILKIPYRIGSPAAFGDNWKKIIGLYEDAKTASLKTNKDIVALNKQAKAIVAKAELLGYDEKSLKSDKIAYMSKELAELAEEYRTLKKKVASLKGEKKHNVKNTSIEKCLELFPEAEKLIKKSERAKLHKYDDDMAEALLLAECARVLDENLEK